MIKTFALIAALFGFLAVALGAFGSHALKSRLSNEGMNAWQIGLQYHFFHVFALFALAFLLTQFTHFFLIWSGYCFVGGVLLFSGSLYLLALTAIKQFGAITPIGGLLLLAGWLFLALGICRGT